MKPKLYDFDLSGNSYKVRLLAALLGVEIEVVPVDLHGGELQRSPLIDLNPFGQVPIFVDGDVVIRDSQAILIYVARKWGAPTWLPLEAAALAHVAQWLMVAENEMERGFADARRHVKFGRNVDVVLAREKALSLASKLEAQLKRAPWLAPPHPTIADIACMPYVALGGEGGLSIDPYPSVVAWIRRIRELPGFVSMPGLHS